MCLSYVKNKKILPSKIFISKWMKIHQFQHFVKFQEHSSRELWDCVIVCTFGKRIFSNRFINKLFLQVKIVELLFQNKAFNTQ